MSKIVLASASPRRQELLKMMGIKDFIIAPDKTEEVLCVGLTPAQTVCKTALNKAKNVAAFFKPEDIIIAADTEVFLHESAFGKPDSKAHATEMLRELSGKKHRVFTGIAIKHGENIITRAEETAVFFRELNDREIFAYVQTGEPMDKAGAYGAQGKGAVFIERLEGDFFNVMGLPVCTLTLMLRSLGVNI